MPDTPNIATPEMGADARAAVLARVQRWADALGYQLVADDQMIAMSKAMRTVTEGLRDANALLAVTVEETHHLRTGIATIADLADQRAPHRRIALLARQLIAPTDRTIGGPR